MVVWRGGGMSHGSLEEGVCHVVVWGGMSHGSLKEGVCHMVVWRRGCVT